MTGHRTGTRTIFAPTGGFRIPTITEIKRKREGGFGSREITRERERERQNDIEFNEERGGKV